MKHARKDYQARIIDNLWPAEGSIPADEPVFLLRAKDIVAPSIVRAWATAAYGAGADDRITAAARAHADAMEDWQKKHGYQVPDMPNDA